MLYPTKMIGYDKAQPDQASDCWSPSMVTPGNTFAKGLTMNAILPEDRHLMTIYQATLPSYPAEHLTQGGATAQITLNGQVYTLRITRQGKLILTK